MVGVDGGALPRYQDRAGLADGGRRGRRRLPDLTLVRDRIIFAEVKSHSGFLSVEQKQWRDRIVLAGGEWHLWRPDQREWITSLLR